MIRVKMVNNQRNQGPSTCSLPFLTRNFPPFNLFVCLFKMFPIMVLSQQVCQRQSPFIFFYPKIPSSSPPGHYCCAEFLRDQRSQLFPGCDGCCLLPVAEKLNPGSFMLLFSAFSQALPILQLARDFFSFSLCIQVDRGASRGRFVWFLYACEFDELSDSVNLYTLLSSGKRVAICG